MAAPRGVVGVPPSGGRCAASSGTPEKAPRQKQKKGPEIHRDFRALEVLGQLSSVTRFLPGNPGRIPKPKAIKPAAVRGGSKVRAGGGVVHAWKSAVRRSNQTTPGHIPSQCRPNALNDK